MPSAPPSSVAPPKAGTVPVTSAPLWRGNPRWIGDPRLRHGVLTRSGLESSGKLLFADCMERAAPRLVELMAGTGAFAAAGADQVHEDRIAAARRSDGFAGATAFPPPEGLESLCEFPATDALVTEEPGVLLIIQTADCLPILYWDPETGLLGASHCGWKGVYAGLAGAAARAMIERGARRETLEAWIGPCIRAANYETGPELVERFRAAFPGVAVSPNGTHLDLAEIARSQLEAEGIRGDRLGDCGECTRELSALYHSYRRDGPRAGRLLTVIARTG